MKPIIKNEEDYAMVLVEVICFALYQGKSLEDFLLELTEQWHEYSKFFPPKPPEN